MSSTQILVALLSTAVALPAFAAARLEVKTRWSTHYVAAAQPVDATGATLHQTTIRIGREAWGQRGIGAPRVEVQRRAKMPAFATVVADYIAIEHTPQGGRIRGATHRQRERIALPADAAQPSVLRGDKGTSIFVHPRLNYSVKVAGIDPNSIAEVTYQRVESLGTTRDAIEQRYVAPSEDMATHQDFVMHGAMQQAALPVIAIVKLKNGETLTLETTVRAP
jgi:hypothetical protein